MKKILVALLVLLSVNPLPAQTLLDEERKFVIDLLEANSKKFLTDIEAVSEEQWKFKSTPDTWSVGEVSEHITLSE